MKYILTIIITCMCFDVQAQQLVIKWVLEWVNKS